MTDPERYPVEMARKKIADLLDGTQFRGEHAEITRRDKPAGYLVPPEWYLSINAEVEELRRKVKELSAAKEPRAAIAAPRQQVTQSIRKPVPSISPEVRELPGTRVKELADRLQDRYPEWVEEIERDHPQLRGPDLDLVIVEVGLQKGLKIPDVAESPKADRPITEEEAAQFAARARSKADEMQLAKLEQLANSAAEGSKDFAVMHAALNMDLLTHDEVYATAPERPAGSEETSG
jgi:PHD/YefM family antitoxin component YafN of YafNO toxin-antitoxin module